ncbi:MAG: hypothetical protein ABIK10_05380 [candidate division WOR-3 bacterium]
MNLIKILKAYQKKYNINQIIFTSLVLIDSILLTTGLIIGLYLPRTTFLILGLVIGYLIYKTRLLLNLYSVAYKIEQHFPQIKNKIVPVVELVQNTKTIVNREKYSTQLIEAAAMRVENILNTLPLNNIVDYTKTKISGIISGALLLILFGMKIFLPEHFILGGRLLLAGPQKIIKISVSPGNSSVNKDTSVWVKYSIKYESVKPIKSIIGELYLNDKKHCSPSLTDSINIVVRDEIHYYVYVKSFIGIPVITTPIFRISLQEPIEIKELRFTCYYPSYTNLPPKDISGNELRALLGSRVKITGRASHEITQAKLITQDASQNLNTSGDSFRGEIIFKKPDSFKIVLTSRTGNTGMTQWYYLLPQNDEPPIIRFFLPGRDINLPIDMKVLLGVYTLDDFGLTTLELHYLKANVSETTKIKLKKFNNRNEDTTFYLWDLSKISLLPGDIIIYYGVVYDNNIVSGPGMGRSETYVIRFPSLTEIFEEATKTGRTATNQLQPILEKQTQLIKELDQLKAQVQKYRNMDWEQKTKLSELITRQEELISEINELQKEIDRIASDLYSSFMLDKEAIEHINQISEILNQILPEEIKERLANLHKTLIENNPQLAKSLEELKLSSENTKEGLRRALELLKNIQREQLLTNLVRKAEEIYKQQLQITERIKIDKNLAELIGPQLKIGEEIINLQQEIDKVAKEIQDNFVQQGLRQILLDFSLKQLTRRPRQIADLLSQNNRKNAQENSKDLTRDLESIKEGLKNLADSYKKNQISSILNALLAVAYNLNRISKMQEDLITLSDIPKIQKVIQQKQLSEAAGVIAESLARYSSQSLFVSPKWVQMISKTILNMDSAAKLLEETNNINWIGINQIQNDAIYYLNLVTFQILNRLQFLNQPGGEKGGLEALLEALSQLTADQMSINQGMNGIPIPIPGGLSAEQLAQLERLMSLQSKLRSQLAQLLEEINMGNYGEMPGLTGSLEGALEEMKKVEEDLQKLNISRHTIERQERVIENLLDAQRSIRQRSSEERRERVIGKEDFNRELIKLEKNLGENKKQLREEIIRSLRANYPREYEQVIRNYFEILLRE